MYRFKGHCGAGTTGCRHQSQAQLVLNLLFFSLPEQPGAQNGTTGPVGVAQCQRPTLTIYIFRGYAKLSQAGEGLYSKGFVKLNESSLGQSAFAQEQLEF